MYLPNRGWSGGAKVLCILHHWGVQLILAYSWARPAILVVGKARGGMFLFLLFLHFHSCSSFFPVPLFHLLYSLFLSLFSLSLGDDTKWPSRVDVSLNPNTINQCIYLTLYSIQVYANFPVLVEHSLYKLLSPQLNKHTKTVADIVAYELYVGVCQSINQGPVVQSVVSLTSSLVA